MAITLNEIPPVFAYSGNQMHVEFTNDAAVQNSVIQFNASAGNPSQGALVKLYFDNEELEFVFNHLNLTAFFNELRQNYIIKRSFAVTLAANVITMTAHSNDDLNIHAITTSNFAPCTVSVSNAKELGINIYLAVAIWNGTAFIPSSFDKSHKIQRDGKAYFNISEAFVFSDMNIPNTALTGFYPFKSEVLKYRIEYAENDNNATGLVHLTSDLFAINGKLNSDSDYLGNSIHNNIFLTASQRKAFNKDDEPRFLSFLAFADYTAIELKINAIDFEHNEYFFVKNIPNLSKGELVHIPISYRSLGLANESQAPFQKYEVFIQYNVGANEYTTETFIVECNRQVSLNYETFLFLNSRGGIDTISFEGETEETATFSSLTYKKDADVIETKSEQHRIEYRYKQYSGYYDDFKSFQYIEELLNSEEVFWLKNGELKRIIIERDTFEKGSKNDSIWQMEFEFMLNKTAVASEIAFAPTTFGNDVVIIPPTTIDPDTIQYLTE